eukprot:824579-Prymnesium_polylepis.2
MSLRLPVRIGSVLHHRGQSYLAALSLPRDCKGLLPGKRWRRTVPLASEKSTLSGPVPVVVGAGVTHEMSVLFNTLATPPTPSSEHDGTSVEIVLKPSPTIDTFVEQAVAVAIGETPVILTTDAATLVKSMKTVGLWPLV